MSVEKDLGGFRYNNHNYRLYATLDEYTRKVSWVRLVFGMIEVRNFRIGHAKDTLAMLAGAAAIARAEETICDKGDDECWT